MSSFFHPRIGFAWLCAMALLLSLNACNRYQVSVNENVVYEPTKYFSDYAIKDAALKDCVRSTIAEMKLMRAEQLKTLLCPAGDIASLSGIERFTAIQTLGLNDNKIEAIDSLKALQDLKQLSIKNNAIVNFSSLGELPALGLVDASGNAGANCKTFAGITPSAKIVLPQHCR